MKTWFKKAFSSVWGGAKTIASYFISGKAASDAEIALRHVKDALPYVRIVGDYVTRSPLPQLVGIPQGVDDMVWAAIKAKFPTLLDAAIKSADEMKADSLIAAALLMKADFPNLSNGITRAAAQLAYPEYEAELEKVVPITVGQTPEPTPDQAA